MKGDFSRSTYQPTNHYSSVRLQQGRVLLDAEWNEQADIALHADRVTTGDVVGLCGAPKHAPKEFKHFKVAIEPNGKDLRIAPGRIYVDGILCENDDPDGTLFTRQADLPGATLPSANGFYAAYLDVWERHVTPTDQHGDDFPALRETALNGPDTATRTRIVWQVKLTPARNDDCTAFVEPAMPTGKLRAQVVKSSDPGDDCLVPAGGGYRRLENQLYRVEIHEVISDKTTFKWSRDNGSIVSKVKAVDATALTLMVEDPGRDEALGFGGARWVELTDEVRTLRGEPGALFEVKTVVGSSVTVLNPSNLSFNVGANPTLRRWDGQATLAANTPTELEDGVEVEFDGGTFTSGDYWLIPARTLTGQVEWPQDDANPPAAVFLARHGTAHHYCALAMLTFNAGVFSAPVDCRDLFPPLTAIAASDVSYDPAQCNNLSNATTVQEAIDILCKVSGGSKSCSLSVGEGGDFATLDNALETLLADAQTTDVNLHLLQGTHVWSGLQLSRPDRAPDLHVKLSGCGMSSRVNVVKPVRVEGLASFELHDLNIVSRLDEARPAVIFAEDCDEVVIHDCTIRGNAGAGEAAGALVMTRDIRRALVRDNFFSAYSTESFTPLAQFFLRTEVQLLQPLYGIVDGDEFEKAASDLATRLARMNQDERKQISDRVLRAIGNANLTDVEQSGVARLVGSLLAAQAVIADVTEALHLIRRAGIQSRPAAALVLDTRFVDLEQAGGQAGIFNLVNDNTARIEANEIDGVIGLHGSPATAGELTAVLQASQANLDLLHQNIRRAALSEIAGGGTLHLRGNRIARFSVSRAMFEAYVRFLMTIGAGGGFANARTISALLRECFMANNLVLGANNAALGLVCNMNANAFSMLGRAKAALTPAAPLGDACFVIGDTGVYVGNTGSEFTRTAVNIADITRVSERAANPGVGFQ